MTKTLFLLFFISALACGQNSLMVSPQTGTMVTSGTLTNFKLISNGNSVAMAVTHNASGKVFIVDINDSNPADKAVNTISSVSGTVRSRISAAIGQNINWIKNIEVNPITNSVYVMAMVNATPYFVKLTNGGNTITALNLNTMPYCTLNFTNANCDFQDMAWGENKLFISSYHNTLSGEIGYLSAPFVHNTTVAKRSSTMYMSNWGGGYYTAAPLEKINYINIGGTAFLCGVTTCAPGFSEPVASLTGNTGLFTVRQSFNMVYDSPMKTLPVTNGPEAYLLNLHSVSSTAGNLYRIGKRFIDGSPLANNTTNNNSVMLRDNTGNTNPSLPATDIMKYPGTYSSFAAYGPCEILALSGDYQTLSRVMVCTALLDVKENNGSTAGLSVYPNPATDMLTIVFPEAQLRNAEASVYSHDGKRILTRALGSGSRTIPVSGLPSGNYVLKITVRGSTLYSGTFIKK